MSELTTWNDPALTSPVSFAPDVLRQIRLSTIDGLLSLPRVGVGVGGFLLGEYNARQIVVHELAEIECHHTFGPSFRLTLDELAAVRAKARLPADPQVVGFFLSKPRGAVRPSEEDRLMFQALCPKSWQIMLVVVPSSVRPTTAGVFGRNEKGEPVGGLVQEIAATELAEADAPEDAIAASFDRPSVPTRGPVVVPEPEPDLPDPPEDEPPFVPPPRPRLVVKPESRIPATPVPGLFAAPPPKPERKWLQWAIAAVVLLVVLAGGFAMRGRWMPGATLDLRSSDSAGHLTIEWNRKAVRALPSAVLTVNDGTDTKTFTVEGAILHSGSLDYERKTAHVTVRMRAGLTEETTSFNAAP